MTISEFYSKVGGDYQDALGRLMTDQRITKYLLKFISCTDLDDAVNAAKAQDWDALFRSTHNLKGVSLNLSLTALGKAASDVCETVRGGAPTVDIEPLVQEMIRQGEITHAALLELQASM